MFIMSVVKLSKEAIVSQKKGLKSLYYCRSKSIQRAENVNGGSSTDITKNVYSQNKLDE